LTTKPPRCDDAGVTASHFATQFYAVKPGDIALVHTAAGGFGTPLTQIVKLRGGLVIARVSSEEKVEARELTTSLSRTAPPLLKTFSVSRAVRASMSSLMGRGP